MSSARFASMLANRSMAVAHFAEGLSVAVDLDLLSREDGEVEFEDLLVSCSVNSLQ